MGCAGCTVCNTSDGEVKGCKSKGSCATGSCNRLNTYDWLSALDVRDAYPFDLVEVSFKMAHIKASLFSRIYLKFMLAPMLS